MSSLFAHVEMAPRDPILGLVEQFNADPNPAKVNLGIGVYLDANGKLPLLECVRQAEKMLTEQPEARGYLPIDGIPAYDRAAQSMVFGADSESLAAGRIVTVQTLGGTGALKVGADLLHRLNPSAAVLISDPSWENHRALFEGAGFRVETYPYYDAVRHGVDFDATLAALERAPAGTIVVLHACCHNPTGCELSPQQWTKVVAMARERGLVPFLDMAYQGFGDGLVEDGAVVGMFASAGLPFLVATSFSKSFSLYGERVGALNVSCESRDEADRVLSQLKRVIRTNYSNPPTHGAQIVATVLGTPELRATWDLELAGMRERIRGMRVALVAGIRAAGVKQDMSFITHQKGMFSYSGLTTAQMRRLRSEFGIYGLDSGRLCVAALNAGNVEATAAAIASVTN